MYLLDSHPFNRLEYQQLNHQCSLPGFRLVSLLEYPHANQPHNHRVCQLCSQVDSLHRSRLASQVLTLLGSLHLVLLCNRLGSHRCCQLEHRRFSHRGFLLCSLRVLLPCCHQRHLRCNQLKSPVTSHPDVLLYRPLLSHPANQAASLLVIQHDTPPPSPPVTLQRNLRPSQLGYHPGSLLVIRLQSLLKYQRASPVDSLVRCQLVSLHRYPVACRRSSPALCHPASRRRDQVAALQLIPLHNPLTSLRCSQLSFPAAVPHVSLRPCQLLNLAVGHP